MPFMRVVICLVFVVVTAAACTSPMPEGGPWRAVIDLPGGALPFQFEVTGASGQWQATVINGQERIPVPEFRLTADELRIAFPAFNTWIEARRHGTGYRGELTLVKRGGKQQKMPFRAEHGPRHRFVSDPASQPAAVAGRWAVRFVDDDGESSIAVAEFVQQGTALEGTFLTPTGDYRFLSGDVDGERIYLSTFDGAHAFLFSATLTPAGELQGDFWSGTQWHESWTARRDPDAALPDANSMTRFVGDRVAFAFPDVNGDIVTFEDPRFAGKVVLITLAGSWCPNCHDEAAFMAPFYEQYRERGLEVVGLMFEHLDDFSEAAQQVRAFRDKFDIGYPLLVAGSSDKSRAGQVMPMLDRVYAFPTTIFVDRNGTVRRVHTGWNGPGTGKHYEELVADLTATVENLLAENQ